MSNRALLSELRARLLTLGGEVPARAESFHRELDLLLVEVEAALSWRGVLGLGQNRSQSRSADRLLPRVDELSQLALALEELFGGIAQVEQQLAATAQALERVGAPALRDPAGIPARLERLRTELYRLGREVETADDLMVDRHRCAAVKTESTRLGEALRLWRDAEEALLKFRAPTRTAVLEAALPELGERLCRDGPTPSWQAELKTLLDPLEQLARRAQPRAISETEKIIKALPRWVRVLGTDADAYSDAGSAACSDLTERFKARRKDWPGEDDRTFETLFEQARTLEQGLLERAAAIRRDGIAAFEAGCALVAELVGPDPNLDEQARDLREEPADDPRDHEDWCEQLREANEALRNRVKRSETALLEQLDAHRAECRRRLAALGQLPRLAEREVQRVRLAATFATLTRAGQTFEPMALLDQVVRMRTLSSDLETLEAAIHQDRVCLTESRLVLQRRAQWLVEQARDLAIALPEPPPGLDQAPLAEFAEPVPTGAEGGAERERCPSMAPGAPGSLEPERLQLAEQDRLLTAAETRFARSCATAIEAADRRLAQVRAALSERRVRDSGLDLAPEPAAAPGDLSGISGALAQTRARLVAVESLLAGEEESLKARALELQQTLQSIPPEPLGHNDRGDREAILRQFQQWRAAALADPVERITALGELIENAEHIRGRIASAARRLQERREALRERLRRFNALFLQGYCPEIYLRVEALTHPPEPSQWPRGAEEGQLQEAERLFRLLERQAQRLAAREIGDAVQVLERQARRTQDPEVSALIAEVQALPPEQPPPARLRRRLAERLLAGGRETP